jgi:hypothetical protein
MHSKMIGTDGAPAPHPRLWSQPYTSGPAQRSIRRLPLVPLLSGGYASGGSSINQSQYEGIAFDDYSTPHAEVVQYDDVASGGSADTPGRSSP